MTQIEPNRPQTQQKTYLPAYPRIHYACGNNIFKEWINVDFFDKTFPHNNITPQQKEQILKMDLTKRHPFPDNSFELAFSEDFIEHLNQADGLIFLSEVHRTLKPGGIIRISSPGLPGVLEKHLTPPSFDQAIQCKYEAYDVWRHQHFYTFETMSLIAKHLGFSKIMECRYGDSQHKKLLHDSRPEQSELNLVVELTK